MDLKQVVVLNPGPVLPSVLVECNAATLSLGIVPLIRRLLRENAFEHSKFTKTDQCLHSIQPPIRLSRCVYTKVTACRVKS